MKLLVTGRTGQVAMALKEVGASSGVDVVSVGRPQFDLAAAEPDLLQVRDARPDVIISAAAYTAVDRAETDREMAERVNVDGPASLANLSSELGIPIIHLSTDYVFDGTKPAPYVEDDAPNPISVYGRTKLHGELAVASAANDHVILRTAWIYSPFGANFLKTMLRLAETRSELSVVDDQVGNPTSAFDVARAVIDVARNLLSHPDKEELRGTFHAAGSGEASWAAFALEIFRQSQIVGGPSAKVARISTAQYPLTAKRPANSRLDTEKLRRVHGITVPAWQISTQQTVRRLLAGY